MNSSGIRSEAAKVLASISVGVNGAWISSPENAPSSRQRNCRCIGMETMVCQLMCYRKTLSVAMVQRIDTNDSSTRRFHEKT